MTRSLATYLGPIARVVSSRARGAGPRHRRLHGTGQFLRDESERPGQAAPGIGRAARSAAAQGVGLTGQAASGRAGYRACRCAPAAWTDRPVTSTSRFRYPIEPQAAAAPPSRRGTALIRASRRLSEKSSSSVESARRATSRYHSPPLTRHCAAAPGAMGMAITNGK